MSKSTPKDNANKLVMFLESLEQDFDLDHAIMVELIRLAKQGKLKKKEIEKSLESLRSGGHNDNPTA